MPLMSDAALSHPTVIGVDASAAALARARTASEPHVHAMTRVWELVIGAARARGARTGFCRAFRGQMSGALRRSKPQSAKHHRSCRRRSNQRSGS
jgi:hypothetical protein